MYPTTRLNIRLRTKGKQNCKLKKDQIGQNGQIGEVCGAGGAEWSSGGRKTVRLELGFERLQIPQIQAKQIVKILADSPITLKIKAEALKLKRLIFLSFNVEQIFNYFSGNRKCNQILLVDLSKYWNLNSCNYC